MSGREVARWTGAAGIAGAALQLVAFVVFFIAGRPPKAEANLAAFSRSGHTALQTSFLLFFVAFAVWFLFFAGLRVLLVGADPGLDFLGTTTFGLGAAAVILGFVFLGLQAAATANAVSRPDHAVIYALFVGGSVLDGVPADTTVAAFLAVGGWALSRSRLLPRWAVLIAQGQSNAAIAKQLVLSPKTISNYVSNIFSKLQVADRAQAMLRAREAGLG